MKKYKIVDGSFALVSTDDDKLEHVTGNQLNGVEFHILATGCDLPAYEVGFEGENIKNDTIVSALDTYQIVFTQKRFLKEIPQYCHSCGQRIERS